MKQIYRSTPPEQWFVYVAKFVFSKDANGVAGKNYIRLIKQSGTYPSFSEAYNRMSSIERFITQKHKRAVVGSKSRSADWCVDNYILPTSPAYMGEKDCFEPEFLHIEVIATTQVLTLKNVE